MSTDSDSTSDGCWGRGLEMRTCEYCGKTKPLNYYGDVETGKPVLPVFEEYVRERDGQTIWRCWECVEDIKLTLLSSLTN
jgi:hypothetical protein